MKKTISYILLTVMLVMQLSGCGTEEKESLGTSNTEKTPSADRPGGQEGTADPEGVLDASAVSNLAKQDNSLNTYSAAVTIPLRVVKSAKEIGGGECRFLGASRAFYFKKHLFDIEHVDECWDEIFFATADGETGSKSFDRKNQVWGIGPVAGTDHYVTFDYEVQESGEDYRYFLTERGEDHEPLREFPLDFLNGKDFSEAISGISSFAVDHSGMVHLVGATGEEWRYQLVSPAGEIVAEYILKEGYIKGLVTLYDGRVAFLDKKWNQDYSTQTNLRYMDAETGRPVLLAALDMDPGKDIYGLTLFDENTLLYADSEGLYRSELSGNNPVLLYLWRDHGITTKGLEAMQTDKEGQIALIYEEYGNYNYLCLKPTTEEVEICEITMAVSSYRMSIYKRLAAEFNKQYPSCHIELKDDYDETALRTELIAGKGPVLVDTSLTGFEEQEKLWEPLDTVMEQLGITDELQPSTLEMGKINGILYGIVTDFSLRTLVTGDPDLKDWDYDAFLQCVQDRPELEAIFNLYGGGGYGTYFIIGFLSHGIDDTYLLDAEAGTTNFDSSEFRRALELAKKYCVREEAVSPGSSLLEGKVLCNELTISKPEYIALYRICYGEDANYIGYPTKDGASHFMESGSPLAIRRTATDKEKKVAAAFMKLCLSYEGQSLAALDSSFGLSVRRDVLEEQIAAMNENTVVHASGFGESVKLGDDLNIELDRKTLLDMIDKARPSKYFPKELRAVLFEELELYFSDTITEDMLIDHLKSRVGLYLWERN